MSLNQWLEVHGLTDLSDTMNSYGLSLEDLEHSQETDLRNIGSAVGLNEQQINRLIKALKDDNTSTTDMIQKPVISKQNDNNNEFGDDSECNQDQHHSHIKQMAEEHKYSPGQDDEANNNITFGNDSNNAPSIKPKDIATGPGDSDTDYDDIYIDDCKEEKCELMGDEQVLPLIIPNNCSYDAKTKQLNMDESIKREKLVIYKPALQFINNIKCKVGTIVICGRARTGKSLIAGELQSPQQQPCPFELGNNMDACTYGIWIGIKPIYKDNGKTCLLILDVEGTGFHESTKQQDMQLMVISLLISSYFIYNTKGVFDSSALDEIEFVTELAEQIQATPDDDTGEDLNRFLPKFMWLLRDVHLEPMIDNESVSIREYFTKTVLKYEKGTKKSVGARQRIREIFLQMFQSYDAYTLPMPHSDKNILQNLSNIDRSKLEPVFNEKLETFCKIVKDETDVKNLYKGNDNGFVSCNGHLLAEWISVIIDIINDADKIPHISSMTEIVMSTVYHSSKDKAMKQYNKLLMNKLKALRRQNSDNQMALEEKDIIDIHLNVLHFVLSDEGDGRNLQSLKVRYDDEMKTEIEETPNIMNKQQNDMLFEFYNGIGHNQNVAEIGKTEGIMFQVLIENANYSKIECKTFLEEYYRRNIESLLDEPENHEFEDVVEKLKQFEDIYYKSTKGPSKSVIWNEFKNNNISHIIEQFEKLKGFKQELIEQEAKASETRDNQRNLQTFHDKQKQKMAQQQKLMHEEMARISKLRIEEGNKRKEEMINLKKKVEDMQDAQFNELAQEFKSRIDEMNKQIQNIQIDNQTNIKDMFETMKSALDGIQKQQPEPQTIEVVKEKMCVIL